MDRVVLASPDNRIGGTLLRAAEDPHAPSRALIACIHGGGCHSGYFETGKPSLAGLLAGAGFQVLLVDRPGTRGRPLLDEERPLAASVEAIRDFIGSTWRDHLPDAPVALVGHSIGGALALTIAAGRPDWPMAALSVSGIGDQPPPKSSSWLTRLSAPLPIEAAEFLLGAEGTYDWRGLARLRKAASPWNIAERVELARNWPAQWPDIASRIGLPVQLRLADGEKIWMTGEPVIQRMAASLKAAPEVDAALLPEGGHLYEFHKRGPEWIAAQATFLDRVLPGPRA